VRVEPVECQSLQIADADDLKFHNHIIGVASWGTSPSLELSHSISRTVFGAIAADAPSTLFTFPSFPVIIIITRGQSNLTKSASRGAYSPVRGHPRGSKFVPLNSWGRVFY